MSALPSTATATGSSWSTLRAAPTTATSCSSSSRAIARRGWQLGGENSGHIICLDKHTTGDGIVSALQVLHAMRASGRPLAELTADLVMYPQVLLNVAVPRGFKWQEHDQIKNAQTEAERSLNGRGRVLLRPSGTEPVLRVMVEGEPREAIESAAQQIAQAVRKAATAT
jgi:phosphoglucosamine mutase